MAEPHWKPTVHQKRAAQAAAIPPAWRLSETTLSSKTTPLETIRTCGILSDQELLWTDQTNLTALTSLLASGSITSEQLATAFCKRAAIAQQLIGCLTEIFFDEALERAKRLDEEFKRSGKVSGPLHGVPVSVKDRFAVEGYDTTVGWVGLANKPAKESDAVVKLLESMGAVLYVKTNIPQSLMMSDSYNHVFGQSLNSLNTALISGGSSGGEGALVGCGGSILGIGTDIGGSVRVPSNLQGLYSICPSTGRVPWDCSYMHQHYLVPPVAGPMARSIDTIEYFMASLSDSAPWDVDPGCIPIPWRKELASKPEAGKKLKLGIVYDDGADTKLHNKGEPIWTKSVTADGGSHCHNLTTIIDEPLIAGMIVGTSSTLLNAEERETLEEEKYQFQQSYLAQWKKAGIDALLLPVTPWVGYRPKEWVKSSQWLGYSAVFNLLDYAGVTVPVLEVDEGLDKPDSSWERYGEHVRNKADRFNWAQYDVDLVKGMPVTVQIVGGRFGEKAVSIAKVVDGLFGR
ncbi:amidase signature domain-containing protein [Aspergillus venezuelensis]